MRYNNSIPEKPDLKNTVYPKGASVEVEVDGKVINGVVEESYPFIVVIEQANGVKIGIPKTSFMCGHARIN